MVTVLSESQLKRLAKHKYNAVATTLLDPYMQVWWRWFVERLPLWIAPNTLINNPGFINELDNDIGVSVFLTPRTI